jgi:hypothetical protein
LDEKRSLTVDANLSWVDNDGVAPITVTALRPWTTIEATITSRLSKAFTTWDLVAEAMSEMVAAYCARNEKASRDREKQEMPLSDISRGNY